MICVCYGKSSDKFIFFIIRLLKKPGTGFPQYPVLIILVFAIAY